MRLHLAALVLLSLSGVAYADNAAFDLNGPPIDIKVTRAGKVLPISQVPNLSINDRIWLHPDLPADQSARYLLICVFLRGSTNPPPANWFIRAETWNKKVREEGIFVVVPEGAQQVVVFLAPETSGDFDTLRSAVRGRPGSFVRATQDLDQASLDRIRLDTYLKAIRELSDKDPAAVHDHSILLARSLNMKLDDDCFKRPVEQQAACLTQKSDNLVLNDGHSQSMVGTLTNGPASDLIGQLTYTPQAGSGYFSPYVGAIVDMGRILDSLHTAQYQYIPALGIPKRDRLELKLNNPPSFHNPKSVLVIALPAVTTEQAPPLHPIDPKQLSCAQKNPLVLQVAGAPLAFATDLAHNMVFHVKTKSGTAVDLPAKADPSLGGYTIDTKPLAAAKVDDAEIEGTLQGFWGFDTFTGPTFKLQTSRQANWKMSPEDANTLIVGGERTIHLHSDAAFCVEDVTVKDTQGGTLKATWKPSEPDEVEVKLPLKGAAAGTTSMFVKQAGLKQPTEIPLRFYGEVGHLTQFTIIPGDQHGVLRGTHLDEVSSLDLNGIHFQAAGPSTNTVVAATSGSQPKESADQMQLTATKETTTLHPADTLTAHVSLKDGRKVDVPAIVESPRPRVVLIAKRVELGAQSTASAIHLTNESELPTDGHLSFSLKTEMPATFPRDEKIEIAPEDYSFHTLLSIADGGLTLQDPKTVLANLDPAKSFGNSAFGVLRFRPVDERGVNGDWQPLANLVRVPSLKELRCPSDTTQQCTLSGTNLFLLDSVAADQSFSSKASVPEGFVNFTLNVPHPTAGVLYVKLRDNPADVNTATLPIVPSEPTPQVGQAPAAPASPAGPAVTPPPAAPPSTAPPPVVTAPAEAASHP